MTSVLFFFFSFSVIWLPLSHPWATKEETHSYDANHYTLPCSTWRSPGATWRGWGPKPNRAHQRDLNPEPCYSKLTRYSTVPFSPSLLSTWDQSFVQNWIYKPWVKFNNFTRMPENVSFDNCSKNSPLSVNFTKWSNTLKQFVGNLPTNCLSVFGHFVGLALKEIVHFCK